MAWNWLKRLTGRSMENPNLSLSDPGAWDEAGLLEKSMAGIAVSRRSALTLSKIFRGTALISDYTAKTPLHVMLVEESGRSRDRRHPAYSLLRRRANPETLAYHFKQTLTAHSILQGGGFAWIERDTSLGGFGDPVALWQLRPDRTFPVRENGRLVFVTSIGGEYGAPGAIQRKLLPENVLHIHGLGYDGLTGYSLIEYAAQSIGSAIAKERYGAAFFRNSASPSVAIKFPNRLSDPAYENLKKSWHEMRTGLENAHKPLILEDGATIEPFSVNARDAQLIEAMELDAAMIANFIGLPPHKLGAKGYSSYASLEQENQSFLDESLDPRFCQWEEECEDKLLREAQKDSESHQIRFHRQSLVRVDMPKRYAAYRTGLGGHPFLAPDEVRSWEDLPAVGLDEVPRPLNMSSGSSERAARGELLADALGRSCRRLSIAVAKAAKRGAQIAPEAMDRIESDHRGTIGEILRPVVRVVSPRSDPAVIVERVFGSLRASVIDDPQPAEAAERFAAAMPEQIAAEFV